MKNKENMDNHKYNDNQKIHLPAETYDSRDITTYSILQNIYTKRGENELVEMMNENKLNMDVIIYGLKNTFKIN